MRLVKLFATGEDAVSRPSCAFVRPLACARELETARRAARFVSLLPLSAEDGLAAAGASGSDVWRSQHAVLASGEATCEEHALLLCSLLRGLGLTAYVVIGLHADSGAHVWVATISAATTTGTAVPRVVFWEALTGARYLHSPGRGARHRYTAVHCVFNDTRFLANALVDDSVEACRFEDLGDRSAWRELSPEAIKAACAWAPHAAPLLRHPGSVTRDKGKKKKKKKNRLYMKNPI
jgi:centrosomal protein CEP76